ncbi:hypothetical protein [Metallosphaera sedula]|uniref:hypothetical protein n=1 Tax=Metallosphaera sedula TaxID=43687 RepID=UPI0020BE8317|nr:hypothetical protein [Metallosphaera sedula]BBL48329.1 hypothetical protein MJ1HA_2451 [Metallosphaera sedula]
MTVYTIVNELLDYAYWGALIFSIGSLLVGILGVATGNQRLRKFLVSGVLAVIIWAAIPSLASSLLTTQAPQYIQFFILALGGFSFIYGLYSFAAGNYSKAAWLFVSGIIVVGVFSLPFFNSSYGTVNQVTVTATVNPQIGFAPLKTTLTAQVPGATSVTYYVNWGDGTNQTVQGGSSISLSHTYRNASGYGITIIAKVGNATGETFVAVNALAPPNLPWPFNALVEGIEGALLDLADFLNSPFEFFWTVPTFPTSGELWNLYELMASLAFGAFGLFVVLNIFSNAVSDEEIGASLVRGFKDVIVVGLAILVVPFLYDVIASFLNQVTDALVPFADPGALLLGAITVIGSGFGAGYFVPELADLGAALSIALLIATALSIIRMVVIYAGILLSPVLLLFSLFPATRGLSRIAIELVMGFILAGPFSAAIFAVLSILANQWGLAGNAGLEVASPFLLQVIPDLLGFGMARGMMGGFGISAPNRVRQDQGQTESRVVEVPASVVGATTGASNTKVVTVPAGTQTPTGIVQRVANRRVVETRARGTDVSFPEKGRGGMVKTGQAIERLPNQEERMKAYGQEMAWMAQSAPPIPGVQEDINAYARNRAKELGLSPENRTTVATYKETRIHALASGIKDNYSASMRQLANRLSVRFDALMQKYTAVRPAEAIRREVGDVKQGKLNKPKPKY